MIMLVKFKDVYGRGVRECQRKTLMSMKDVNSSGGRKCH